MARISIVTADKAKPAPRPEGLSGGACSTYLDTGHPLQLHQLALQPGETITIRQRETAWLGYVWHGSIEAGGTALPAGSSLIVETGASLTILAGESGARLLAFAATTASATARSGGQVHLLPTDRVPRADQLAGAGGVAGAMHADGDCPGCEIWLHENHFPGMAALSADDARRGVHSHSEDEIIFVTAGEMRLGDRLCGPGTALAIAADTLYSFTPGPAGLSFINFRGGRPGDIRFASGASINEPAYWRERLPRPQYLTPA